jgi:ABC-type amino acid transport system permease subunit
MFTTATVLYFLIATVVSVLMHLIERRARVPGMIAIEAKRHGEL